MSATVITRSGRVEGSEEHGMFVFRGIPYARPPVGARRFRAPEPAVAWRGTRPTQAFAPSAPQNGPSTRVLAQLIGVGASGQSEDCLCLNIWTPAADRKRRPVMLWIHGGAFVLGSGATGLYAGGRMAKRGDVVVVTINYRLGALGFLNLHALDDRLEANFGVHDQIAALEWVRDNIEQFGGDPEKVTIFGESAGGMSVGTLLSTRAAGRLFHRAVAQSGAASNVSSQAQAAEVAEEFVRALGERQLDVERLRRRAVPDILAAQMRAALRSNMRAGVLPWQPSIDDQLLRASPLPPIAAGSARTVALLVGTNRDEWRLFMIGDPKGRRLDEAGLRRRLARALATSDDGDAWSQRAFDVYARADDVAARWTPADRWVAFQSDRIFHHPAHELAASHAHSGGATYAYLFTWTLPLVGGWSGSFHGLEIPFVFGTVRDGLFRRLFPFHGGIRRLSDIMQQAWVAFARHGAPHHDELPTWPRYDSARRASMAFDTTCAVRERVFEERQRLWSDLAAA